MIIEDTIKKDSQKAKVKDVYILEFTKSRILWSVIIALLILTFIFTFGYWTGSYNTKVNKKFDDLSLVGSKEEILKDIVEVEKKDQSSLVAKDTKEESGDNKNTLFNSDLSSNNVIKKSSEINRESVISDKSMIKKELKDKNSIRDVNTKSETFHKKKQANIIKSKQSDGKFSIQFASFNSKEKAIKLKESLLKKGYKAYVVENNSIYRVRIGNFRDYNDAASTLSKAMQEFKVKDAYIIK